MTTGRLRQFLFGVFIGLAGLIVNLTPLGLALEEKYGLYWLFHLRGAISAPDDVVVISIDQPSSTQLDLPINPRLWPRDLHARLIEKLASAGARIIVFDLVFETPSDIPGHDAKLVHAMQMARNVIVVERLYAEEVPLFANQVSPTQVGAITARSIPLLPMIENAALAQAPFILPRAESVNAFWTFVTSAGDAPTLPVVAMQAYTMAIYDEFAQLLVNVHPAYASKLFLDKKTVDIEALILTLRDLFNKEPLLAQQVLDELERNTDLDVEETKMIYSLVKLYSSSKMRYLNFFGPPRTIQTIPYHQVLHQHGHNHTAPGYPDFNGKVVFIGFSAATQSEQDRIRDDYYTIFSNPDGLNISGVEIAATAFANLLENKPIRPLPLTESLALLFLFGFTLGVVFLVLPNQNAMLISVVLIAAYVGGASYQFEETGTWLPLFIPLLMQLPLAVFGSLSLKYYNEKQERRKIEKQFGRFLPERIVKHIKENAGQVTSSNKLVYGVCLATDVEGYTSLSERMSPGRLNKLMNEYYAVLFEPVEKHGGDVSDVVGDAMLALWTTSSLNSDARQKACMACLDIAAAVDRFNQTDNRPKLTTRIGLHFGELMLGSVGASRHFEYRAVGDVVNTTNRIQSANKKFGTSLLLSSEVTKDLDDFLVRPLGDFLLTGKFSSVSLAELVALKQAASSEQLWLCKIFADAMQAYNSKEWQQACDGFLEILKVFPHDGPAQFFLKRCQQYELTPSLKR